MAVDESQWQQAVLALRRALGDREADALIAKWDEPAWRDDLRQVEERLDGRLVATRDVLAERIASVDRRVGSLAQMLGERMTMLEHREQERFDTLGRRDDERAAWMEERTARLEERIDRRAAELTATVRGELNAQLRSLLFGFVGLQTVIGGFVMGLLRFGI